MGYACARYYIVCGVNLRITTKKKINFLFLVFFFFFCTLLLRSAVDVPTPLVVCSGWKKLTEYDNIIMISFRGQNNKTRSCTLYLLSIRSKPYCYTALILLQSHEYKKKKIIRRIINGSRIFCHSLLVGERANFLYKLFGKCINSRDQIFKFKMSPRIMVRL